MGALPGRFHLGCGPSEGGKNLHRCHQGGTPEPGLTSLLSLSGSCVRRGKPGGNTRIEWTFPFNTGREHRKLQNYSFLHLSSQFSAIFVYYIYMFKYLTQFSKQVQ